MDQESPAPSSAAPFPSTLLPVFLAYCTTRMSVNIRLAAFKELGRVYPTIKSTGRLEMSIEKSVQDSPDLDKLAYM